MFLKKYGYAVMVILGMMSCTENPVTGTISDTDTGKLALVYNPDLTPAAGASVAFYSCNDTVAVYKTVTDKNGNYSIPLLSDGSYNIIARKDSLVSFQDSVTISKNHKTVKSDTLGITGSFTAIAALQVNHDPRTIVVHVLGTDVNSNVDEKGMFLLKSLARGTYNIVLKTSLPDYSPKYATIKIESAKSDTLIDTIYLTYTGIPVVNGLKATYDTVRGVVAISWSKTNYRNFQDYVVFRDNYDSTIMSTKPIAALNDTVFTDTIFKKITTDTISKMHYKYRVAVRSNVLTVGQTFKYVDIVGTNPNILNTVIEGTLYHQGKKIFTDSASINDTITYSLKCENKYRSIKRVLLKNLETSAIILDTLMGTPVNKYDFTTTVLWNDTGSKAIECSVECDGGLISKDTVMCKIIEDQPVIEMLSQYDTVWVNDTCRLQFKADDKFGYITKWELSCDSSDFKTISGHDTAFVVADKQRDKFRCIVRATDDDGMVQYDTIESHVNHFKAVQGANSIPARSYHGTVVFKDRLYFIGGFIMEPRALYNDVWSSADGDNWIQETDCASFSKRSSMECFVFDDKLWVYGGKDSANKVLNDMWQSSDGKSWTEVTPGNTFPDNTNKTFFVFDGKLWMTYLSIIDAGHKYDIWNSSDGVNWTNVKQKLFFSEMRDIVSIQVLNGVVYMFGKEVIYSSRNGIDWSLVQYFNYGLIESAAVTSSAIYLTVMSYVGSGYNMGLYKLDEKNKLSTVSINDSFSQTSGNWLDYINNTLITSGAPSITEPMVYSYKLIN